MRRDIDSTLAEKITNYSTVLLALLGVVLGLALMVVAASWDSLASRDWQRSLVNELGGLLVVTGGLSVLWDLRGKRDLIREVLAKVRVSSEVQAAGVVQMTMNWMDIEWDEHFKSAHEIDVFISYGSSWRKLHWPRLQEFTAKKRNKLRIFLPDPKDESTMKVLAQRYDYTPEKIQASVLEMAHEMATLSGPDSADIRVYYRAGDPTFTCYRFDETVLVTLYSHKRQRGSVPAIALTDGTFKDYFLAELEAIHGQSVEVPLAGLQKGTA